jgi:hypothetical protein
MYADRTYRLVDIVDRRRIPGALSKVFGDTEGKIKNLSGKSRAFALAFMKHSEQQRMIEKENTNGKAKKNKSGKHA